MNPDIVEEIGKKWLSQAFFACSAIF